MLILTVHFSSPAMSTANQEAQSSIDALPFRQGALDVAEIRRECPQFRILIIGKANAGKTTILRKVCNAGPDSKPAIHDAEGNEVRQDPPKVRPESWHKPSTQHEPGGYFNSHGGSRCLSCFDR